MITQDGFQVDPKLKKTFPYRRFPRVCATCKYLVIDNEISNCLRVNRKGEPVVVFENSMMEQWTTACHLWKESE